MKLIDLLASLILAGTASGLAVSSDPLPEGDRPLAGVVEIRGALSVELVDGVTVIVGKEVGNGWFAMPDAQGIVRLAVDPTTDAVFAVRYGQADWGGWTDRVTLSFPVESRHRLEQAVRDLVAAQNAAADARARFAQEGGDVFAMFHWITIINNSGENP